VNAESNDFFRNTLRTLDQAYLRPNWTGFIDLQNAGFGCMKSFIAGQADAQATLAALNHLAAESRTGFQE
jgi:multiple sugar transport system substrate-binding protein